MSRRVVKSASAGAGEIVLDLIKASIEGWRLFGLPCQHSMAAFLRAETMIRISGYSRRSRDANARRDASTSDFLLCESRGKGLSRNVTPGPSGTGLSKGKIRRRKE